MNHSTSDSTDGVMDKMKGVERASVDVEAPTTQPSLADTHWMCCGRPTSKAQIMTIGQLIICAGIISFAAAQMATADNDRDQGIYLALMTAIFGLLAPSPISKK
jgi:hypothetical protein